MESPVSELRVEVWHKVRREEKEWVVIRET